ncbi:LacI family DNA-binding transcriptional regulator [Actinoplanes sp. L3-i22]|uniref:LacI family DNA-binding transcriptional regulator n=1 Tax=Actinoplanes sp. L3-i22 TaxID=2836373 RepID=UPI001C778010|nr:LacI family DNA-binding transcriptional regulator [Actinoplanes sp. L3-i22]BCY11491.1 LacI family transcriptional regulator [Actinoplanes sp. L3-i22]
MAEGRRATLKDVAAASGVSRATVSFVLNDTPNQTISAATREKVLRVVRELGYKPHGIARALREGSSRIVVLFIESGLEGNYSRSYLRGLDQELSAHGYVLVVRHGPTAPEAAEQVLDAISPRAVLRFGEVYRTGHALEDLSGGWRDGLAAHTALQIGYLAEQGHTEVALALPDEAPLREIRLEFSQLAAGRLGLPALRCLVIPRSRPAAVDAVRAFREQEPAVTAIAAHDDDVALRAVTALTDLGLRVPGDCAVIGFDDNEYGALFTPALTTIHIDAEAHGRVAARELLGLDAAGLSSAPAQVLIRQTA